MPSVLFLEDDAEYRLPCRLVLEAAGYHVAEAGSVAEARELLKVRDFDVVVLDYWLSDGTCLELGTLLRTSRADGATRVIVMTAQPAPNIRREVERAGVDSFVRKPADPDELVALLEPDE